MSRLKALADPARLELVQILARFPDPQSAADPRCSQEFGACACHLEERLGLSAPTISHHLKVLREAGLVESLREGKWVYFRLSPGGLGKVLADLAELQTARELQSA